MVAISPLQNQLDLVLTVERKVMPNRQPAAGPEGQQFTHATVLPLRVGHTVPFHDRTDGGRVTEGHTADFVGRHHVPVQQRRRDRQDIGNIVKAVSGLVGRQQLRFVDLKG